MPPRKSLMKEMVPVTFDAFGRAYHLHIASARDLQVALDLDEALWVATCAPIETLNCDGTFLRLVDTDGNGRIRCNELKEGIRWLLRVLRDPAGVTERSDVLHLAAVDAGTPEGAKIVTAARKMLAKFGTPDAADLTLSQVQEVKAEVESTPVSEAGVVLPAAADDRDVRQFITDIIATVGGREHPSGFQGVGAEELDRFLAGAAAYLAWREKGLTTPQRPTSDICPLGEATARAFGVLTALRGKLDQYFAQCEAAALDERFVQRMGWTSQELEGLDFDDPAVIENVLRKAPLAKARADRALLFEAEVNPHYAAPLERFRREVAAPALGEVPSAMSAAGWQTVKDFFAAHGEWAASKPGEAVEPLGAPTLAAYRHERFAKAVRALIAESRATAFVLDNIRLTEKLILYQAKMIDFANNFVSFPDLYDPRKRAIFEAGSLVMDGRRLNLAVRVGARAEHKRLAQTSNMHILYVDATTKDGQSVFEAAVPVTAGGVGNICLGKRGVFYDVAGREYDARVVDYIENPVGFREALVAPFRRLGRMITGKIESIASTAEKRLDTTGGEAITQVAQQPGAQQQKQGSSAGMLVGAGVAVAALGSAVAYITKTLGETHWSAILIGLGVAVLLVILPTVLIAMFKLRKRDLSAILEGSGWAVNARMRLTVKQSRFFTARPAWPKGARGVRKYLWRTLLILVLLVAVVAGTVYLLRGREGSRKAPGAQPAPSSPAGGR